MQSPEAASGGEWGEGGREKSTYILYSRTFSAHDNVIRSGISIYQSMQHQFFLVTAKAYLSEIHITV